MAKGPNADPTGPPESILVWEGQADDVAPVVETKTPEPAPVVQPPATPNETAKALQDITDGNFRMLGFLMIPVLLFTSVLVGIGSAGSTIECGTIDEPEPIGTKTINGTTYDIYVLEDVNLGRVIGGNGVQNGDACELSDLDARNADSHTVWIRTQDYRAWTECTGDVYHCETEYDAVQEVREGRFTWFAFELPGYNDKDIDAFYTYDNQGLLGSGSFAIATLESNDLHEVEFRLHFDDKPAQFCFAWAMPPLGLFLVNRMASPNVRDELREGITAFLKFGFKAGLGFAIFVMALFMFILMTW